MWRAPRKRADAALLWGSQCAWGGAWILIMMYILASAKVVVPTQRAFPGFPPLEALCVISICNSLLRVTSICNSIPLPDRNWARHETILGEKNVAKGRLNNVHCEPSFTGAELQSFHPRVPSMPLLPPEVLVCVARREVRVKIQTAARQPTATRSELFVLVSRMMIYLAE